MNEIVTNTLQPPPQVTRKVAKWIAPVARLGFAAKGVVYLLLGWFALRAALLADEPLDRGEALAQLRSGFFGETLLLVLAVGLLAHVLWRLTQSFVDPEHAYDEHKHLGPRLYHLGSAMFYSALAFTAWDLTRGGANGDDQEDHWTAVLLAQPYGRWLVYAAGLAVIAYGLRQFWRAWKGEPVIRHLALQRTRWRRQVEALGRFGVAARGVVFTLIGGFVLDAARRYDPEAAGGTDEALSALGHGPWLGIVAAGLIAYGLFQFFEARYHRIGPE